MRYVPNFLTICNLLSGCLGIVFASDGNLNAGAYMIWLAAVMDFFDGLSARALNANSNIGGELDSLADMVSFGVLPSFIVYELLLVALPDSLSYLAFAAFLIAASSAIRLAIFNVDTRQTSSFIGLPTPASALLISALPLSRLPLVENLMENVVFLMILVAVVAYLLNAQIELMAFKFKNYSWQDNKLKYSFMLISLILVIALNFVAIPIIVVLYIFVSLFQNSTKSKKAKSS